MRRVAYNDFPFAEVAERARFLHETTGADVFQKWSCKFCGSRQTMEQPNQFFTSGICEECKGVTDIEAWGCNFSIVYGRSSHA